MYVQESAQVRVQLAPVLMLLVIHVYVVPQLYVLVWEYYFHTSTYSFTLSPAQFTQAGEVFLRCLPVPAVLWG